MKKLTALVLALCMALGLAACGGSKDTGSAAGSTADGAPAGDNQAGSCPCPGSAGRTGSSSGTETAA